MQMPMIAAHVSMPDLSRRAGGKVKRVLPEW
jgi:hypothetical protein